jgi:tRNA pseudouridine55 synthase
MKRAARPGAPEGGLVVDKPAGLTSHDVVAAARRALGQPRIGHTGTLDPMATGVLVLLLGRATRLAQFLAAAQKTYLATIVLGQATSTYDAEGAPSGPARPEAVERARVEAALEGFRGSFLQTPPAVSAKKVGGHRAYDLARAREMVVLQPVPVEVTTLDVIEFDGHRLEVRVTASAGFYVRSLAHDLGERVGTGAHLAGLRRERSGALTLGEAVGFDLLMTDAGAAARRVVAMADLLGDWPSATLGEQERAAVGNGRPFPHPAAAGAGRLLRLLGPDGALLGLADPRAGLLHPVLVLV